jgi:hypothetical protein
MDNVEWMAYNVEVARQGRDLRAQIPDTVQSLLTQTAPSPIRAPKKIRQVHLRDMSDTVPLINGALILHGHYRITRFLYQRPRLNLYLGRRIIAPSSVATEQAPLVVIRELLLHGLPTQVRTQIEAAAFEEFVSPTVLGSPRLSVSGDRVQVEGERHYLVMQIDTANGQAEKTSIDALTLDELLLSTRLWPTWLTQEVALNWATQLCRMVARLQRLDAKPGTLSLKTILVDRTGFAGWAPLLLPSWPPAPQFWGPSFSDLPTPLLHCRVFPIAECALHDVLTAPETLYSSGDERSDVYALGALLYLLMTHYAPITAARRLRLVQPVDGLDASDGLELVMPRLLNTRLSTEVEQILLRVLEFDPNARYQTVFELVEALEGIM